MNPGLALAIAGALLSGVFAALQAPTNAMLARAVNSPVNAALISFLVGTVALVIVALGFGVRPDAAAARALPWYAWIGGLYGAFFVVAAAFATPRMGVAFFIGALIGGQLLAALVLDHLGAFGLAREPINVTRLGGVLLIFAGVLLVRR
jgi:bacterial/archaeal transporter family-2 protein